MMKAALHRLMSARIQVVRVGVGVLAPLTMILLGGQLGASAQLAGQQQPEGTCSLVAQQALAALDTNCTGLGRNSACYGYRSLSATFNQEVPLDTFSRPADRTEVVTLQSITTTALDEATDEWGVALLSVQANLPGTLPGQAVAFVLMGDTTLVNNVSPDEAALPTAPILVFASASGGLRTEPDVRTNAVVEVPVSAALAADALSEDGAWARVVYSAPTSEIFGGWFPLSAITGDVSALPVVTAQTRTPMQSFLFRTGIGAPRCEDTPSSLVVQGPNNTEVALTVNGTDITIGSTIQLQNVEGAPPQIINALDLPAEVIDHLQDEKPPTEPGEEACAIMQLSVISGAANLNENDILPEGNTGFSVYCAQNRQAAAGAPKLQVDAATLFLDPLLDPDAELTFTSGWGGFRPLTDEELDQLALLENIPASVLNYSIERPEIGRTPTPTRVPAGRAFAPPATRPLATATLTPTAQPTSAPPLGSTTPAALVINNPASNGQTSVVGQPLPVPFSINTVNGQGNASPNTPITFIAPANGPSGTFAATGTRSQTVYTNSAGQAGASTFTSNGIAGTYTVIAQVGIVTTGKGTLDTAKAGGNMRLQSGSPPMISFTVINMPAVASVLSIAAGSSQSAPVGQAFPTAFAALVSDSFGNPVPGIAVTFASPGVGAGGAFGPDASIIAQSDSSGLATATAFTANILPGSYVITLSSGALPPVSLPLTNLPGAIATIQILNGDGQTVPVMTVYPQPLRVRALDSYGNLAAGAVMNYATTVTGASATFAPSVVLDANGEGEVVATANSVAGTYTVTASADTASAIFTLNNTAGPVVALTPLSPASQQVTVAAAFSNLQVQLTDAYGNYVPNVMVTYAAPAVGATAVLSSTTAMTDSSGVATISATANTVAGSYSVNASEPNGSSFGFSLTNNAGAPTTLTRLGGNGQATQMNTAFSNPLVVQATDAYGNITPGVSVTFTSTPVGGASAFINGSGSVNVNTDPIGEANVLAAANGIAGTYTVDVSAGVGMVSFTLTNNAVSLGADIAVTELIVDNPAPMTESIISYTLTVFNNGPDIIAAAAPYYLSFPPPPGTFYNTHAADSSCSGYNTVEMVIDNLAVGSSCVLTITVHVDALAGSTINQSTSQSALSTIPDPVPANNNFAYPTVTVQ